MAVSKPPPPLAPHQAQALFDILVHRELYLNEVTRFNRPDGIDGYGPPFDLDSPHSSTSPILQSLLYRFILPLPGVNSFSSTFWANVRQLLKNFSSANLSQSYEHTGLGLRRTLATGSSALLEYPARGIFGGFRKEISKRDRNDYDPEDPDDMAKAFAALLQEVVYGEEIDALIEKIKETPDITQHDKMIQAAHEYILINYASVLHNTFVEGPDSAYLQSLVSNILKLIPWTMLRQTLRIGNAASMISAVTRLFLAKLSLTSFTNWIGLSNNPDDGQNLLQQIAATIFGWDIVEYQKRINEISSHEDAPSKEHLEKIKGYAEMDTRKQDDFRQRSMNESKSIITIICEEASLPKLTRSQHEEALKYLGLSSSLRDREQLSRIICKSQPDLLTQTIREGVNAYDPIIRKVHQAVDLSTSCWDLEEFLRDFFNLFDKDTQTPISEETATNLEGDITNSKTETVSVEDIASVLRKHQGSLHKYLHQMAKNGGDVTEQYRSYVKTAAANFRVQDADVTPNSSSIPSSVLTTRLTNLVIELPTDTQTEVLDALDSYSAYLTALSSVSYDRLSATVDGGNPPVGPGTYLARWTNLMKLEPSTPLDPEGKPRYGVVRILRGGEMLAGIPEEHDEKWRWPDLPSVNVVVEACGEKFKDVLGELGKQHWIEHPNGKLGGK